MEKEEAKNKIFNVCHGQGIAIRDLAKAAHAKLGGDLQIGALPYRANEIWEMIGDNQAICTALGYTSHFNAEAVMEEMIHAKNTQR